MARPPDLVLFMTDQQRFDQVGYASNGHFETPVLDELAARGVVFDCAYSAATVCVPARTALLTGLHPHRLPTQDNGFALREGTWTVAHALRSAGYETALFGKMHFAPVHAQHGFDVMRCCEHLHAQAFGELSYERGDVTDDYHDWLLEHGYDDWRFAEGTPQMKTPGAYRYPYPLETHPTNWIAGEVEAFLAERDRDRPLFLVVSFPHPHAPYNPPEPYASMFDPQDSELPASGVEADARLPMALQLAAVWARERTGDATEASLRTFAATVRGLIRQIDDAMGAILAHLDLATTSVAFTSDHGDYAGNRGLLRKNPPFPYDDLARVPMLLAGGPIRGGRRVTSVVQSSDIARTFLDYAGVEPPPVEFESRSLRPLLDDPTARPDATRAVYCATSQGLAMVRRGPLKYLRHRDGDEGVLFDLDRDPGERENRVDAPEYAAESRELDALLQAEFDLPLLDLPVTDEHATS
jgi:arylsulfatase